MGTSNKKTMSPLTADQQWKVDSRRRLKWSIEKIARDLQVSEKRVSAYLKSKAAQQEATSAKKPAKEKKVAPAKKVVADKKPTKAAKAKPTKGKDKGKSCKCCDKKLVERKIIGRGESFGCMDFENRDDIVKELLRAYIPAAISVADQLMEVIKSAKETLEGTTFEVIQRFSFDDKGIKE